MFGWRAWRVGKVMGIPISIDPSWLIILAVLTYLLGTRIFPYELGFRRSAPWQPLLLGFVCSLLLFASVLAHELSHAWMAVRRGIPVLGITLFIFGGVAQIGDEPEKPSTEFLVAIMGPLMSLGLALILAGVWIWSLALGSIVRGSWLWLRPVAVAASYLAGSNLILVLFNLLPGFPLDGGRVLRAILWSTMGSLRRATRIAVLIGRGIAILIAAFGVWNTFQVGLDGVWSVLLAIFLWQAAGESYRSVLLREALESVSISHLMKLPSGSVPSDLPILTFVERYLMPSRGGVYAIEENGRQVGLIGGDQLRDVPRERWRDMCVRERMLVPSPGDSMSPDASALAALKVLSRQPGTINELPVIADGRMIGVIGSEEIARYLNSKGQ